MVRRKWVLVALLGLAVGMSASQVFAQAENRQKVMKSNSADAKAIKAAVEAKDYATVETKAKELMGNADQVALFPKGSKTGKTKAKPELWEKPDDFVKAAKSLGKAAGELAAAAKSGDDAAVGVKFKALGDTCTSCHKAFRADKYSE
jgi:cytochrome c556